MEDVDGEGTDAQSERGLMLETARADALALERSAAPAKPTKAAKKARSRR
jgi:hypothetical protein